MAHFKIVPLAASLPALEPGSGVTAEGEADVGIRSMEMMLLGMGGRFGKQ